MHRHTSGTTARMGLATLGLMGLALPAYGGDMVYTIDVTSEATGHALSHITFDFGEQSAVRSASATVIRTFTDGSTARIVYTLVQDEPHTIKFEDANLPLGEDGEVATDRFVIRLSVDDDQMVDVQTKHKETGNVLADLAMGDSERDRLGFRVTVGQVVDLDREPLYD